jgi:hypothetical protein
MLDLSHHMSHGQVIFRRFFVVHRAGGVMAEMVNGQAFAKT